MGQVIESLKTLFALGHKIYIETFHCRKYTAFCPLSMKQSVSPHTLSHRGVSRLVGTDSPASDVHPDGESINPHRMPSIMHLTQIRARFALMAATASIAQCVSAATFGDDTAFLKGHTEVVVLRNLQGASSVAVVPAWQGRVMTSGSDGDTGFSYGWINRELIGSGKILPHMNAFGGEDRFWMGPEGGQFSIFFQKANKFEFANWFTPAIFDTLPFYVVSQTDDSVLLGARFTLTNYSGTRFEVVVKRNVRILDSTATWKELGVSPVGDVRLVTYETSNSITNIGKVAWKKETGLLSVWILGMYNPSPSTTIVVPIRSGPESDLGVRVTSDYFGSVPKERLTVTEKAVFFAADGKFRSKIGISPKRSMAILGSYDGDNKVLTLVRFNQPSGVTDYVNSLWKLQDNPYDGDAANAYNDGPATPGAKPMGPFCELESSSPAAALAPGETLTHVRRTVHLSGPRPSLDILARATLGVSLDEIENAFPKP